MDKELFDKAVRLQGEIHSIGNEIAKIDELFKSFDRFNSLWNLGDDFQKIMPNDDVDIIKQTMKGLVGIRKRYLSRQKELAEKAFDDLS